MALTNEQLLVKFEQDMQYSLEGLAESTIRFHMMYITKFLNAMNKPAFDITKNEISAYVMTLKKQNGEDMNIDAKQNHLSSIKRFYKFLFDGSTDRDVVEMREYLDANGHLRALQNPAASLVAVNSSPAAKLLKNPRKEGMTYRDTQKLLQVLRNEISVIEAKKGKKIFNVRRDFCFVLLVLETGLRHSDASAIELSSLVLNNHRYHLNVTTQKNKKQLRFILSEFLSKELEKYLEIHHHKSNLLFCTSKGTKYMDNDVNNMLHKYKTMAGIEKEVTCHTLRHTCGALMYNETKDLAFVKELLGHGSITTTQRYVYSEDVLDGMAETTERVTDRLVSVM